tara:strand:+ start:738 stop:1079 length:342 start_codon:yes stop_codon:yes gene_type:complete
LDEIVKAVNQYGFPVIAAVGLGYFVFFIWKWVTETIDPIIGQTMGTLIALVDRVRMLDNDMIRLNMKLSMLLEHYEKEGKPIDGDIEEILKRYGSRHEDVKINRSSANNNSDT